LLALAEQKVPKMIHIDVKNDQIIYLLDPQSKQEKKKTNKKSKTVEA